MYNYFMTLEIIKKSIEEKLKLAPVLGAIYKFDFGDQGCLLVDASQSPAVISEEDGTADTTFKCSIAVFNDILSGVQDPTMAFMMGKLKIEGSMGYAMKLNSILGD
ncbi:MAG: SCP2 sterol-binding domain-containing protein [Alphaproteobacteria bacterium]|nr:SCP2 sterol-binding domain-containing protein [Alphaproteobacteria bacterium]